MSEPIKAKDIRVGDTIQRDYRGVVTTLTVDRISLSASGGYIDLINDQSMVLTIYDTYDPANVILTLLDRPVPPAPKVGDEIQTTPENIKAIQDTYKLAVLLDTALDTWTWDEGEWRVVWSGANISRAFVPDGDDILEVIDREHNWVTPVKVKFLYAVEKDGTND